MCALQTLNIDLANAGAKAQPRHANLAVRPLGRLSDRLERLAEMKAEYRRRFGQELIVIEDCAACLGIVIQGTMVGSVQENFACFSFQAIKSLTCGDGGL